ncbi:hypothetical protein CEQ90_10435 [Lewinellaceae bacterium SD302]|nr:hypothetical protein CEQ90_10435 [Lewinellaceae bacterium SD302]
MKQFLFVFMFLFFVSCTKDEQITTSANEHLVNIVHDEESTLPSNRAPFYNRFKDIVDEMNEIFGDVKYDPAINSLVVSGDLVYGINNLMYMDSLIQNDTTTNYSRQRVYNINGRWNTINRDNVRNVRVHVEDAPTNFGTATPAEKAQAVDAVEEGILRWNNIPNSDIEITIVESNESPDCTVSWFNFGVNCNFGRAAAPSNGDVGIFIEIGLKFLNQGDGQFLNFEGIKSVAAHEMGHALGFHHNDNLLHESIHICNTPNVTTNSIMTCCILRDGHNGPCIIHDIDDIMTDDDENALSILYPRSFPNPNVSVSHYNNGFPTNGIIEINYSMSNGFDYPKAKIKIKNLSTGETLYNQIDCFTGFFDWAVPYNGASTTYECSVQIFNWRQDKGSNTIKKTIYVP